MDERRGERALDSLHAGDLLLAYSCSCGDARALAIFDERIVRVVRVKDLAAADETRQRLRALLLLPRDAAPPRIVGYRGHGPLLAWVQTVTRRLTSRPVPARASLDEAAPLATGPSPEDAVEEAERRERFRRVFYDAVAELSDSERRALRMYYLEGAKLEAVAEVQGVSRATAARWLVRTREKLLARLSVADPAHSGDAAALAERVSFGRILAHSSK